MWAGIDGNNDVSDAEFVDVLPCIRRMISSSRFLSDLKSSCSILHRGNSNNESSRMMVCESTIAICSEEGSVEDGMGNAPSPWSKRACRTAESFDVSFRLIFGAVMVAAEAIFNLRRFFRTGTGLRGTRSTA